MSGSIRLYVETPLTEGTSVSVGAPQAHYLGTVMRRRAGDAVRLFNGRDGEYAASLDSIRRERAELTVGQKLRPQAESADLWLAFALLKREATDLVVEKATELGAAVLLPVITERTNTHRVNQSRLATIAMEAAEQCERLTLPVLHPPRPLGQLLDAWPHERRLFVAVERATGLSFPSGGGPVGLLVGPEGGFTPAELDAVLRHPFVTSVTLGPNVLRAETACIAGLALLQAAERA